MNQEQEIDIAMNTAMYEVQRRMKGVTVSVKRGDKSYMIAFHIRDDIYHHISEHSVEMILNPLTDFYSYVAKKAALKLGELRYLS